jgi:hypothetical protein
VIGVVLHRAGLVAVEMARDREDGKIEPGVVLRTRIHILPEAVVVRVLDPALEHSGRQSRESVEIGKRPVLAVHLQVLPPPVVLVSEQGALGRGSVYEREPPGGIAQEDPTGVGIIPAGVNRGGGHYRRQRLRALLERLPLHHTSIRSTTHRHPPVAPFLARNPCDDVVSVGAILFQWPESTPGSAPTPSVHVDVHIAVLREEPAPLVRVVGRVRREREHRGSRRSSTERPV